MKNIRVLYIIITLILSISFSNATNSYNNRPHKLFVSPNGNDNNPGTIDQPFATLSRAQKQVRDLLIEHLNDTLTIYLREGSYILTESFRLNEQDAGTKTYPVIYCAYNNESVSIKGGLEIPVNHAVKVTDKSILNRLLPKVRGKICYIDLKKHNIQDYGLLKPRGFGRPYHPSAMEFFCNKKPFHLARWPNDSMIPIGEVIDPGSVPRKGDFSGRGGIFKFEEEQPRRWKKADDIWISGYFHYGFADDAVQVKKLDLENKTISTEQETMYGFANGSIYQKWYAFNLLEEIDEEGEYYIDRKKGILYFYQPSEKLRSLELSIMEGPLISIINGSNIHFKGITFECSRGMGIYIEQGQNNKIEDCTFHNLGLVAICIGRGIEPFDTLLHNGTGKPVSEDLGSWHEHIYDNSTFYRHGGTGNVISGCNIYNIASGGISLSGGNRLTLEKGKNIVENCRIYNFNRLDKSYRAGINIDGVGNEIRHCEIFNCTGSAIYLHGNDHLIEYNEIHHAVMKGDDMGAIYYGRNPSEFGNKVRYNYFHHIGSGDLRAGHRKIIAIYHDDGACGMEVTGNIFYKAGSYNISLGGGNDNIYRNNIFIDAKLAIHHDNRLQGWAKDMWAPGGTFEKRLKAVNFQSPPYSESYPELVNYFTDSPGLPKRNVIEFNLFMDMDKIYDGKPQFSAFGKNIITCEDPGFVDFDKQNFNMHNEARIFSIMPEFESIPFHKMGLIKKGNSK